MKLKGGRGVGSSTAHLLLLITKCPKRTRWSPSVHVWIAYLLLWGEKTTPTTLGMICCTHTLTHTRTHASEEAPQFVFSSRPCGEETEVTPKTKANRATPRRTHKSAYGGSQVCAWLQEGGRMLLRRCCWRLRVRQGSSECHYPHAHAPPGGPKSISIGVKSV